MNKKICMVGAFAVGKTSLVKRYVESLFSEKYHTTIGVKIDKKNLTYQNKDVQLMIWDIEGVDIFTDLKPSYLRGASGILLVIDGTRSKSLETAKQVKQLVDDNLGKIPTLLLINKSDLRESWQFSEDDTKSLAISENNTFITSAKTDQNVERAFERITHLMVED
jgi:small GTP-binding protein